MAKGKMVEKNYKTGSTYPNPMYIDMLEQTKGTLQIILYLKRNGKTEISYIARDNDIPRQTCYTALEGLEDMGVIVTSRMRSWPPRVFCQLTERGTEIANLLDNVDDTMESTIEGYKRQIEELGEEDISKKEFEERLYPLLRNLERECFKCGKWDEALKYGNELVTLSQKTRNYKGLAEAERNIGMAFERKAKPDKAFDSYQKSIKAARKARDSEIIASNLYNIGNILEMKGQLDNALASYRNGEEYAEKSKSNIEMGRANLGVGRILAKQGLYGKSSRNLRKAVRFLEKTDNKDELLKTYSCLGSAEYYNNTDEAIRWHERCIEASERFGNTRMLGYGLSNAAVSYIKKGRYSKAEKYLDRAQEIFEDLKEKGMVSNVLTSYALLSRKKRRWSDAKGYLQKAMKIVKLIDAPDQTAEVFYQYGLLYRDKGNNKNAKRYMRYAMKLYKKMGSKKKFKCVEQELKALPVPASQRNR
jgi:tetratricopeptide (TPR) repeat protein